jgi:hypothetical protein
MRLSIAFVIVVAVIAVVVMPAGTALGQAANPGRELPDSVQRGQTFDVTVNFTALADDFNSIALRDTAPNGWNVTVNEAWCDPYADGAKATGNQASFIWIGPYDNGTNFTAKYKVTVPRGASPGNHTFNVSFPSNIFLIYHIEGSSKIAENIAGDFEVEVVVPTTPIISHSPASFGFGATRGGSNPENRTLEIWNSGIDTLNWTLSDDAEWLSEDPTNGSSTGEHDAVAVLVNIAGMPDGDYSANITITAPGASNSPQTVPVTLYVERIGPLFTITSLDVTPEQVPPGQPVTVSAQVANIGDSEGSYTVNLTVNGQVEQTKTVTLAPEAMETVTFTVTKETPGSYTVSIGDLTEEFTVAASSWLNRYWWMIVIVVGVAAVVLLAYSLRRRRVA